MPALGLQHSSDMTLPWAHGATPSFDAEENGLTNSSNSRPAASMSSFSNLKGPAQKDTSNVRLAPQTPYLSKFYQNGGHATSTTAHKQTEEKDSAQSLIARRKKFTKAKDPPKAPCSQPQTSSSSSVFKSDSPKEELRASPPPSLPSEIKQDLEDPKHQEEEVPSSESSPPKKSAVVAAAGPKPHSSLQERLSLPPEQDAFPSRQSIVGDITTPFSISSYAGVSESAGAWGTLGHYNILHVTTSDPGQHWFTRYCCYLVHCSRLRVSFSYPNINNKMLMDDDRVKAAIEQVTGELVQDSTDSKRYKRMFDKQMSRGLSILNNMKAAISTSLIRLTGYVLFKVFSRLLTSVVVHKGQLEAVERASKTGTPLIFVPLHRSHMDYLFVTWVLFNCQIPAPVVAAGDNLNMPVFGALLRGLGGFFIKRRLESNKARRDVLYRALLQCYMSHALHSGYNLEFFIEGGRTRTGKPAMPKGGLLSVILDAYLSDLLDDAMIVPIAINYDKLVDGNFIREQMGQSKVPESFWGAVSAICKVLSTNYGQSRIDFGAPFSLKEFVERSKLPRPNTIPAPISSIAQFSAPANRGHCRSLSSPITGSHLAVRRGPSTSPSGVSGCSLEEGAAVPLSVDTSLQPAMSSSSLFGTELTDEFRNLVKNLGRHIVFDAERCQAIMSSNLVAWVTAFEYRHTGASLQTLSAEVDVLREELRRRGRDVGFTGSAEEAVKHAVGLLGDGLIKSEGKGDGVLYSAVTVLPNVIELNYYASALLPVFALDAIVATSLLKCVDCDLWSYIDCDTDVTVHLAEIMKCSTRISEILAHEFVLAAPCTDLSAKLRDAVDRLVYSGLLSEEHGSNNRLRYSDPTAWLPNNSSEDEEDFSGGESRYTTVYRVSPTRHTLKRLEAYCNMLTPLMDGYCATVEALQQLVGRQMLEKEVVSCTQALVTTKLNSGVFQYEESIAADPIKNCLKMLEGDSVVESAQQEGVRCYCLTKSYDNLTALQTLLESFAALKS